MVHKSVLLLSCLAALAGISMASAECNIANTKLEQAILQKPELREPEGRQTVRDLRSLRDAAFILWSYGRQDDCERLMANIRELVSESSMASWGTTTRMKPISRLLPLSPPSNAAVL